MKGTIEVICGPMFSGKTEELIKRVRRCGFAKQDCVIFKPSIDNRYSAKDVASHDGKIHPAITVQDTDELEVALENIRAANQGELPDVVGIEEVQFFGENIVQIIYDLKVKGIRVIAAGLDMDWKGYPFNITTTLMGLADKVDKQAAICVVCGDDGTYSYLKNKTGDQIQVGTTDKYEARCFNHWAEEN